MRQAILFLLGLAVGAIAAANVVSTLRQRDAYPRGLMHVMQHDVGMLRDASRTNRCDATAADALQQLHGLSVGIETAVYGTDLSDPPDPPFAEYAKRLRATIPAQLDCKSLPLALDHMRAACDACHREYR
jgi:hypothetical protein